MLQKSLIFDISKITMGVEHGGLPSEDGNLHRNQVDHADGEGVRHTAAPEPAAGQSPEGDGQMPVAVFDQVAELQRQLADAQAELERRRAMDRAASKRWREKDPERARALTRARVQAHRARKRQ